MIGVFLDVTSAYDNVQRNILVDSLRREGCPSRLVRFVNNWMENRNTKFIVSQSETDNRKIDKGLPQGGVISPTLYALYTKSITKNADHYAKILQYADDIAVYIVRENKKEVSSKVGAAIYQIETNLSRLGLEVEPDKTQVMYFYNSKNNKHSRNRKATIRIKDKVIENKDHAKFLDIVVDQDLKFDKQVKNVQKRVEKAIEIIKYLNKVTWGMELKSALYVYNSYVRAMLDYGLFIYFPRDWKGRIKLEKIQNKGIRLALGYRNSTPINVMLVESNSLRLEDRAGYLARNYWTKVITNNERDLMQSMNRLTVLDCRHRFTRPRGSINVMIELWRSVKKYIEEMEKFEKCETYNYWDLTNRIEIEIDIGQDRKEKKINDAILLEKYRDKYNSEKDYKVVYTDGSKKQTGISAGIGIAMENSDIGYRLNINQKCSIFTTEAIAIEKALGYMQETGARTDLLILTDSQSVCKAIANNNISVHQNNNIYKIKESSRLYQKEKNKR